jgi:hypothetical protein
MRALPVPAGVATGADAVAGINDWGVSVGSGYAADGLHIIGWYGAAAYDVTGLVANSTGMSITQVTGINDRFEVSADAIDAAGVVHPVVLTPST